MRRQYITFLRRKIISSIVSYSESTFNIHYAIFTVFTCNIRASRVLLAAKAIPSLSRPYKCGALRVLAEERRIVISLKHCRNNPESTAGAGAKA